MSATGGTPSTPPEAPFGLRTRRNVSLAPYSTMRVGGPADLLVIAHDAEQLAAAVAYAHRSGLPFMVLGRGSNVVFADRGFRGLVIVSRAEAWRREGNRFIAEAGLPMARAATEAGRAGLAGLEFGLAIPGTVGGAVWANAGAHGSDVASILEWATVMEANGTRVQETAAGLGFGYRESALKHGAPRIVLDAAFRLTPADPATIQARHDDIRRWRREHQPLNLPSAGSVFRNPPQDSAGRLIDAAGLKGRRRGGAAVSGQHANFIVNEASATAADVRGLAEECRAEVARRFGVDLLYEVQFAGDWSGWGQEEP